MPSWVFLLFLNHIWFRWSASNILLIVFWWPLLQLWQLPLASLTMQWQQKKTWHHPDSSLRVFISWYRSLSVPLLYCIFSQFDQFVLTEKQHRFNWNRLHFCCYLQHLPSVWYSVGPRRTSQPTKARRLHLGSDHHLRGHHFLVPQNSEDFGQEEKWLIEYIHYHYISFVILAPWRLRTSIKRKTIKSGWKMQDFSMTDSTFKNSNGPLSLFSGCLTNKKQTLKSSIDAFLPHTHQATHKQNISTYQMWFSLTKEGLKKTQLICLHPEQNLSIGLLTNKKSIEQGIILLILLKYALELTKVLFVSLVKAVNFQHNS